MVAASRGSCFSIAEGCSKRVHRARLASTARGPASMEANATSAPGKRMGSGSRPSALPQPVLAPSPYRRSSPAFKLVFVRTFSPSKLFCRKEGERLASRSGCRTQSISVSTATRFTLALPATRLEERADGD
jgi:hypothetical protein